MPERTREGVIDIAEHRRIALIADTHGPVHHALVPRLFEHDCVVHAGDIDGLQALGIENLPFYGVCGNNDTPAKWPKSEGSTLETLPQSIVLSLRGGLLAVIHGHQYPVLKSRHDKLRSKFAATKAVLYGHSHRPVIDKSQKPWVVNPGAAGRVRAYGSAGFISLTTAASGWRLERISLESI